MEMVVNELDVKVKCKLDSNNITEKNFFDCTIANWKKKYYYYEKVERFGHGFFGIGYEKKKVVFKPDFISKTGSEYMYTKEGVYRKSNHWGDFINTCIWRLEGKESEEECVAFCNWFEFKKYTTKENCTQNDLQEKIIELIRFQDIIGFNR